MWIIASIPAFRAIQAGKAAGMKVWGAFGDSPSYWQTMPYFDLWMSMFRPASRPDLSLTLGTDLEGLGRSLILFLRRGSSGVLVIHKLGNR